MMISSTATAPFGCMSSTKTQRTYTVELLQPNGAVAVDDIIIHGNLLNCVSHLHENGVGFMQFCENIC